MEKKAPILRFIAALLLIWFAIIPQTMAGVRCDDVFSVSGPQSVTDISDADLLKVVILLQSGLSPDHLSEHMQSALQRLVNTPHMDKEAIERLHRIIKRRMGMAALGDIAGSTIASARSALLVEDRQTKVSQRDDSDFHRGWGWQLLPENDPAFIDPRYLAQLVQESGSTGRVMNIARSQVRSNPWASFAEAWTQIAPNDIDPSSIQFALTGTDANNSFYYIASRAYQRRSGGALRSDVEILVFDGSYGGGSGRIGRIGIHNRDINTVDLRVVSPDTAVWNPTDPVEIARLESLEAQALNQIEEKVRDSKNAIGGILIESVLGSKGVRFYRPEFLVKVRELCDRIQIPIFADEVLTGGGRTGTFFGYQNYPGFTPDFVSFGKGLQVAGVAQTKRGQEHWGTMPYRLTTLRHTNEALLKAAQVMNRIREGKLMENAKNSGAYLVAKLRAQGPLSSRESEVQSAEIARGLGLLVFTTSPLPQLRNARGRLMPPLTITKDDVDYLFGPSVSGLGPEHSMKNYRQFNGGAVKLRDGAIVEGSVEYGGIQPNYVVNLKDPVMADFLNQARAIGETSLSFWEKAAKVAQLTRQTSMKGWEYESPEYLNLMKQYREQGKVIPLEAYLKNNCGVCREQGMLLHLALESAGFDSAYLYVKSYEDGIYVEDHAVAIVKYKGEDWIVDSRSQENSGRRLKDAMKPDGMESTDPVAEMNLPSYRFDPSGTRFEIAPYPIIWVPH